MRRLLAAAALVVITLGGSLPAWSQPEPTLPAEPAAQDAVGLEWPARRFAPCAAFDEQARRWFVFGGRAEAAAGHWSDTWMLELGRPTGPAARPPRWRAIATDGDHPPAVRSCSATFDSTRRQFVVFGGWDGTTASDGVWVLSARPSERGWRRLCAADSCGPGPTARRAAQISYDAARDRLLLFGGVDSSYRNDLWALSLRGAPRWERLAPTGAVPPVRGGHAQVLDDRRGRLWVIGGTAPGTDRNDVWALDLATTAWTEVIAGGCGAPCPTPRSGLSLVHDRTNDRLVVYGGWESGPNRYPADAVALTDLGGNPRWEALVPASEAPQPRYFHVAAYDPAESRMLVFGGGVGASAFRDAAALYLPADGPPTWRGVVPRTAMTARDQAAVHLDVPTDALFAYGGFGSGSFPGRPDAGSHLSDVGRLRLGALSDRSSWRRATPGDGTRIPLEREAAAAASDAAGRRLFVVGGLNGDRELADVWVLSTGGGEPSWDQLCDPTSCGEGPPARWGAHAVYDPAADRVVVYGGRRSDGTTYDDTWTLTLGARPEWVRLDAGTPPPARWGGAVAYDHEGRRMIVTAGQRGSDANAFPYDDTWALSLDGAPTWQQLRPLGPVPPARRSPAYATAFEDGSRALLLVGGFDAAGRRHHNDVWELDLSTAAGTWRLLAADDCADPTVPACRRSASAVVDPRRGRLVMVFGRDDVGFFGDVSTFDLRTNRWLTPGS